jgi:hypothetical protein
MVYGQVWYVWARYQPPSGHYIGNSSILDLSSQLMEAAAVSHPRPRTCYKHLRPYSNIFTNTLYRKILSKICIWARYQCSSGNNKWNSSILDLSSQLTEAAAVSHPRPRTSYNIYILILIYSQNKIQKHLVNDLYMDPRCKCSSGNNKWNCRVLRL